MYYCKFMMNLRYQQKIVYYGQNKLSIILIYHNQLLKYNNHHIQS